MARVKHSMIYVCNIVFWRFAEDLLAVMSFLLYHLHVSVLLQLEALASAIRNSVEFIADR